MRTASVIELRLWVVAIVAFAAVFAIGAFVSSRPPSAIDLAGASLRGQWTPLAAFFTALGRGYAIAIIAVVAVAIAAAAREGVRTVVLVFASQVVSQGAIAILKPLYHRARPETMLLFHETDFSYPSGHSATAIVFFATLGLLAARGGALPRPAALACALAAATCAVGIPWSRLALGAHYATDVAGGVLFGVAWACAAAALGMRFGVLA